MAFRLAEPVSTRRGRGRLSRELDVDAPVMGSNVTTTGGSSGLPRPASPPPARPPSRPLSAEPLRCTTFAMCNVKARRSAERRCRGGAGHQNDIPLKSRVHTLGGACLCDLRKVALAAGIVRTDRHKTYLDAAGFHVQG